MPKFAIVDTVAKRVHSLTCKEISHAMLAAGLKSGEVDFGTVGTNNMGQTLNIVVYEFGLYHPEKDGHFVLNNRLYNGNAVLFMADEHGETIDLEQELIDRLTAECEHGIKFLGSADNAEAAIQKGEVERPQVAVNGQVIWTWNSKKDQI